MNGLALLVAGAAIVAQPSAASEARTIKVREADAGRLISVKSGQDIVIQLASRPGSTNQWRVRSLEGLEQVAPVDTATPLHSPAAARDPRVATIRLRGTTRGEANAVIEEAPIGGGLGSNYLRFHFRLHR